MAMKSQQLKVIQRHYRTHTHKQIAAMIGVSHHAVRNACSQNGWKKRADAWSDEELSKLVAWYLRPGADGKDTLCLESLAQELGRSKSNVCRKARSIGLTKSNRRVMLRESRQKLSKRAKEQIAHNGHPRGARGLKHSDSTRKKIGEKSAALWKEVRDKPMLLELRRQKQVSTNLERYGTAAPTHASNQGRNVYSRCKRGVRKDLGIFVRSRWEANYARYLKWLEEQGQIACWEYEPITFRFDGVKRGPYTYKPDFKVVECDGTVAFHEVKGWMDSASKGKIKRFEKFYPQYALVVVDQKTYRSIERKVSSLIPNWEKG